MFRPIVLSAALIIIVFLVWVYVGRTQIPESSTDAVATTTANAVTRSTKTTHTAPFMNATLHTSAGDIKIAFDNTAPNTVANFTKLASEGFYDGTKFHCVFKGESLQGGDPLTKDDSKHALWGTGGPGYTFADEIHPGNENVAGSISMIAPDPDPDSNGSQFFINLADHHYLDSRRTVFAHVIEGMEVAEAIAAGATKDECVPLEPIAITGITLH